MNNVAFDLRADFWDELPATVKADVKTALKQSEQGKGKPHKEVIKKYKKWSMK